tara:strand:+ start:11127 stop:11900 length:774 start_codon:yes stop_codon:yes gene_type:complete
MATFQTQVMGMTNITISSTGTEPTEAELTQFLTDGAKETLNALPSSIQRKYGTSNTLNNSSTTLTLGSSKVLSVTRYDGTIQQPTRQVDSSLRGRISDSSEVIYATITDPAYYIHNGLLSVYPTPTATRTSTVETLNFPSVAYSDSAIAKYPDDAEYLVVLYASIKSLQSTLSAYKGKIVHSDQDGTFTSSNVSSQGWEKVRFLLESEEDTELSSATAQSLSSELQQFVQEYNFYQTQQQKLQVDYDKGIQLLLDGK